MSLSDKAAEVAEDYRHALEDLTANSRYEISNLTVVARENTEHAHAISETLADHIKKVAPQRKLPALYVLDSIVKNVGTPYTLFFGRGLYRIFMDAYASVDNQTRRKMDEMLKTWKEPVPGSIDTRPVFPPDVVRPIESALIKARTTALQAQQESIRGQQQLLNRGRPVPAPYRNTPTPPGLRPGSQQTGNPYAQPPPPQQTYPMHANNPNAQQQQQYPPRSTPQPQPGLSTDQLSGDIQQLIVATKGQFAQTPHDGQIQTRLKALLDLQAVLQHQNLSQDQLVLVKNQVAQLAVDIRPPVYPPQPQQHQHQHQHHQHQQSTPVPPAPAVAPPPQSTSAPPAQAAAAAPPLSLDSLFGQGALAALLAGVTKPGANAAPAPPAAAAAIRSPIIQQAPKLATAAPAAPPPSDPMALLAMLRQSGLLPPAPSSSAPPMGAAAPAPLPPPPPAAHLPQGLNLAGLLSPMIPPGAGFQPPPPPPPPPPFTQQQHASLSQLLNDPAADVQLNHHSLRVFRPHLVPLLHEALGPPCTQCGRRFRTDAEGRRRKTAHMDWHFRVHQRLAEAERRGQHRSWYVDDRDWVRSREAVDAEDDALQPAGGLDADGSVDGGGGGPGGGGGGGTKAGVAGSARVQYIPVPEDPKVNTVCPICQEKFEMKWLDEAQEWVWTDALKVGARAYHASCYGEATKSSGGGGRGGTPARATGTPEPVLGKRKAEDELASLRGKVKLEGY